MRKTMFLLAILAVLILAGCKTTTTTTSKAFIGGTDAINLKFLDASPPDTVQDGGTETFDIAVELSNDGEADVLKNDINVKVSGISAADFNNPTMTKNANVDLNAKFKDSEGKIFEGDNDFVTFSGFSYTGQVAGPLDLPVRVTACYKYQTKAQSSICILEDLVGKTTGKKVCEVNEDKTMESSAAPVQVENLRETASSNKVQLTFDVVKKGDGKVSREGSLCNPDDEIADRDKVFVEINTNLDDVICSNLEGGTTFGFVTLRGPDSRAQIRCTQSVEGLSGDFETLMKVNLKYDYENFVEKTLTVEHVT